MKAGPERHQVMTPGTDYGQPARSGGLDLATPRSPPSDSSRRRSELRHTEPLRRSSHAMIRHVWHHWRHYVGFHPPRTALDDAIQVAGQSITATGLYSTWRLDVHHYKTYEPGHVVGDNFILGREYNFEPTYPYHVTITTGPTSDELLTGFREETLGAVDLVMTVEEPWQYQAPKDDVDPSGLLLYGLLKPSEHRTYLRVIVGRPDYATPQGDADTSVYCNAWEQGLVSDVLSVFDKPYAEQQETRAAELASAKAAVDAFLGKEIKPHIFIGHGRSPAWRELKDYLRDLLGYTDVDFFEREARAGVHTGRVLDEMLNKANFALLVMTGEDETADDRVRARQNVIHEAGLFQGRLGWNRAIILREDGVEPFSNVDGLNEIRFGKGSIRDAFGEVVATLRREFRGQ
jgi:predicted nucleotide-binding protein